YSIQKEVSEKERKIRDCEGCFEHLDEKKRIEKSLEMAELAFKETGKKIQKYKMEVISLKEQLSLAKKLHLEN
ncbi:MAG: SMC family ATPase, partial [Nitrosopumilaceae archaeon]